MRLATFLSLLCVPAALLAGPAPSYKDVAAIFANYCYGCHASTVKMGTLALDSFDGIMKGGHTGQVIVPGKSAESRLFQLISGKASPAMPMDGRHLTDKELSTVQQWIDAGANGPAPGEAAVAPPPAALPYIQPKKPVKPQIFSMAYRPDGTVLAVGGFREVRLVNPSNGRLIGTLTGHADAVRGLAFSKDGKFLAAAGGLPDRSGEVKIWNVDQRSLVLTIKGHTDCIYGVAFSPDGKTIATGSYDKLIKLWDVASGKEIRTLKDHIDAVYAVAFTPDGKRLVSGSADRSVKVWDVATGKRLYTLSDATDGINTLALDPTGTMVVAGGLDKTIRVWKLGDNDGKLLNSLIAHEDSILSLAWSPDGKTIVSGSADKTIKVVTAADLTEVKALTNQPDWVYAVRFSPDGKSFAAGRFDGSLSIYDSKQYNDLLEVRRAALSAPGR
ncbi:MAG TPA: c-type cytochrome domain-containing protein [Bryobacteraceae bacterium]|nr:c-type cytochrome domain-containing protein [Bryobacteraceae bacterium]